MTQSCQAGQPAGNSLKLPGEPGIWVFVLMDLVVFALLFLSFVNERHGKPEVFRQSQQALDVGLGLVNMVVLLTSSWFVALAVRAARNNRQVWVPRLLALAAGCGLAFVAIKIVEYSAKFQAGISMLTNDFFMFYFLLTFIHFMHVIAGTVVLFVLTHKARHGTYHADRMTGIETGATYWHMVDLLWVMLFPLIYLSSGT